MARALVLAGVPAVVASQFELYDTSAKPIAKAIYRGVLSGGTIDQAVFRARQAIYQQFELENTDWGSLVLYLRAEDGVIFRRSEPGLLLPKPALLPFIGKDDVSGLNKAIKSWANSILNAAGRRQFLVNASVDDVFINRLTLDSNPNLLAMAIVAGFREYKVTKKNPEYHPMLAMLGFILEQDPADFGWGDEDEELAEQLVARAKKILEPAPEQNP